MFNKQGIVITTCTGAGRFTANFDMGNSLFFWGVGKRYALSAAVKGIEWSKTPKSIVQKLEKKTETLAKKMMSNYGMVKPNITQKGFFKWMKDYGGVFECDNNVDKTHKTNQKRLLEIIRKRTRRNLKNRPKLIFCLLCFIKVQKSGKDLFKKVQKSGKDLIKCKKVAKICLKKCKKVAKICSKKCKKVAKI